LRKCLKERGKVVRCSPSRNVAATFTTSSYFGHWSSSFAREAPSSDPFKLEHLNTEGNYVAQVHEIISDAEMNWMMEKAQSNLKATPYTVNNIQQESSNLRSSKVTTRARGLWSRSEGSARDWSLQRDLKFSKRISLTQLRITR